MNLHSLPNLQSSSGSAPLLYSDKPVFGFDLGYNSVKLIQVERGKKQDSVTGYGFTSFDQAAVQNGVIVQPEIVAEAVYDLIAKHTIGSIDTRRVVASVPVSRAFTRILTVPYLQKDDLAEAVYQEADQYIPLPIDDLYIDYEITDSDKERGIEALVVAAPKILVDSYMQLFDLLGLEVAALETTISSSTRLVMHAEQTDVPTLIMDWGSVSTDLSIFDTTLRVTGTVAGGGDTITKAIARELDMTPRQAHTIKTKHGIAAGKRQAQIQKALDPQLEQMVAEIKKMVRYYQERTGKERKLEQVIILGGGANMPGLAGYLTDKIRIPTRMCNPWLNLSFDNLQPPHELEKTLYATAAGLALATPKELRG